MKSELMELRDEIGWLEPKPENMGKLINAVMECLTEIDSLRAQVDNLRDQIYRMKNHLQ